MGQPSLRYCMATSHDDWTVEQAGPDEQITLELRDGEPRDMRVSRAEETVEMHVDEDGIGTVEGEAPPWLESVAERIGLYEVQ